MKKIIIGSIAALILLVVAFHQGIIGTYNFYHFQQEHPTVITKANITWKTMSFTSTARTGNMYPPLTLGTLVVPVIFAAEYSKGDNFVHAEHASSTITLLAPVTPDFFAEYDDEFTSREQTAICALLSKTSGLAACDTPRNFREAFLKVNSDDAHFFTKTETKDLLLKLLIIKAKKQPAQQVSEFETEIGTGFLYYTGGNSRMIEFFTTPDTMYTINLTGLTEAEVAFVLSNLTVQ